MVTVQEGQPTPSPKDTLLCQESSRGTVTWARRQGALGQNTRYALTVCAIPHVTHVLGMQLLLG